jgi:hypothetical protein
MVELIRVVEEGSQFSLGETGFSRCPLEVGNSKGGCLSRVDRLFQPE